MGSGEVGRWGDAESGRRGDAENKNFLMPLKFSSLSSDFSLRPPSGSEVWNRREPPRLQLPHRVPASPPPRVFFSCSLFRHSSYNEKIDFLASAKGFNFYSRSVNRESLWRIFKICLISCVRSFLTTRVTLRSRTITTSSKPIVTTTSSGFEA